jgi:hypothetical protein
MGENDTTPDGAPLFDTIHDGGATAPREDGVVDEGLAYRYPPHKPRRLRIAPSHGEITNTVVVDPWPSPTACVRLDNGRFSFDSSFPHATMSGDLARLQGLRPFGADGEKIAIFGHADPTGTDEYNKTLSGRRAKAIYGLLIRSPELWDQLHQQPFEGDHWGIASLHACLRHLGYDTGSDDQHATAAYHTAMNRFETNVGLPQTMGRRTRLELFGAYMDSLMGATPAEPRAYEKEDFVGEGKEPDHRGAFQGCGERNPAMVVSKEEDADLGKPKNHKRRNTVQAANRRVLIFLYAKDDVKDMSRWECPSAKAGPSACDKVKWSNVDERHAPGQKRREVRRGGKTFGCKFYDFTARISPCEALKGSVRIWLMDRDRQRMPNTPYRARFGTIVRTGVTDAHGLLEEENIPITPSVFLEWGTPTKPSSAPRFANPAAPAADGAPSAELPLELDQVPQNEAQSAAQAHLALATAVTTAEGAGEAGPEVIALRRALKDGQFPQYIALLPPEERFPNRKTIALNAETKSADASPAEASKANAERLTNLSAQAASPAPADDQTRFKEQWQGKKLEDVHSEGITPQGSSGGKKVDASAVPNDKPSIDPYVKPIRDALAGDANGKSASFKNLKEYETTVLEDGSRVPPPNDVYTTPLYKFAFLGKEFVPTAAGTVGVSKNFGTALLSVVEHLWDAFLQDDNARDKKVDFLTWVMVSAGHSGARDKSDLHGSGSAIDMNGMTNPWFPVRTAAGKFGGEFHSATLSLDKPTPTPLGKLLADAYGTKEGVLLKLNEENVWKASADAVDRACQAIYGVAANISPASPGETYRACYERLAIASSAVARFTRLAYGHGIDLKKPLVTDGPRGEQLTYARLPVKELCEMAVELRLMGYLPDGAKLADILAAIPPLAEPDRSSPATVAKRVVEIASKLDKTTTQTALVQMQNEAVLVHYILRRGMVHGSVEFFATQAEAEKRAGSGTNATTFAIVANGTATTAYGAVASWRDPRNGFMNHRLEMVEAFHHAAKKNGFRLRWGAVDLGIGGGTSGDMMHFDFSVHDPGVPVDPQLALFRSLQAERAAAYRAHAANKAQLDAASASLKKAGETRSKAPVAKVVVDDLKTKTTELIHRLEDAEKRLAALITKVTARDDAQYHAVFTATTFDDAHKARGAVDADAKPCESIAKTANDAKKGADQLSRAVMKAAKVPVAKDPPEKGWGTQHDNALNELNAQEAPLKQLTADVEKNEQALA